MTAKKKETTEDVASASDLIASQEDRRHIHPVKLPSGVTVLLRDVNIHYLINSGLLPTDLFVKLNAQSLNIITNQTKTQF